MERPIIFSTDMVKAILEGHKTQTRRVIKKPENYDNIRQCDFCCPYGQVGDKLWVRETWKPDYSFAGGGIPRLGVQWGEAVEWKAGNPDQNGPWKPSIFMPKWASRITLEITEIRVERLQEISYEDARAEGILSFDSEHRDINGGMGYNKGAPNLPMRYESTAAFMDLWDSINSKKYPWSSNLWVWVISFKPLPPTGEKG